jgi:hypothetical protein
MNYYDARQHSITEKWAYTCRNGGDIWPVGSCGDDGGHETDEQARSCYRDWLLANRLRLRIEMGPVPMICQVAGCDEMTGQVAEVGHWVAPLCSEHMDAENVMLLFPPVGSQISSY